MIGVSAGITAVRAGVVASPLAIKDRSGATITDRSAAVIQSRV